MALSLGERIRVLRKRAGLTGHELAARAAISRTLVSQIESGRANPSVESLSRIAGALGVRTADLFTDEGPAAPVDRTYTPAGRRGSGVVRAGSRITLDMPGRHARLEMLTPSVRGQLQVMLATSELSDLRDRELVIDSHEGEEWFMVLEGHGEVAFGDERHILGPGDSFHVLDCTVPHGFRMLGDEPGKAIEVQTPPRL